MKKLLILLAVLVTIGFLLYISAFFQPQKISRTSTPENKSETQTFSPQNPGEKTEDIPENLF